MKIRSLAPLAAAFALSAPLASQAQLSVYTQDFETLAQAAPFPGSNAALSDDGWLVFASVVKAVGDAPLDVYGPFPAPNSLAGWSGVGTGASVPGNQNMGVYSDYTNANAHTNGLLVQASVFQQRTLAAEDVGTTWFFRFDAKLLDLAAPSTALAFIQTLDPNNSFAVTGQNLVDLSSVPDAWVTYSLPLTITAGAGQILQFGFATTATNYNPSTNVYDNILFAPVPEPSTYALMLAGLGLLGMAARRGKTLDR